MHSLRYQSTLSANNAPIENQTNHLHHKEIHHHVCQPEIMRHRDIVPPRQTSIILPKFSLKNSDQDLVHALECLHKLKHLPPDELRRHHQTYDTLVLQLFELKKVCKGLRMFKVWKQVIAFASDVRQLLKDIRLSSIQAMDADLRLRSGDSTLEDLDPPTPTASNSNVPNLPPVTDLEIDCCPCNAVNPLQHCGPPDESPMQGDSPWSPCPHGDGGTRPMCRGHTPG